MSIQEKLRYGKLIKKLKLIKIFTLFILVTTSVSGWANSDICNIGVDASTDKEWIVSNICNFKNTAVIKADKGYLIGRYNPFTYFKRSGIYVYDIEIIKMIKGDKPKNIHCLKYSSEKLRFSSSDLSGTRIVSFDSSLDGCIFPDIAKYPSANSELIRYAEKIVLNLDMK